MHGHLTPPEGRLESRLVEGADGIVRLTRHSGKGQLAITDYVTIASDQLGSILRLTLRTGRKHQIRSQLAEMKTPVINDVLYGDKTCSGRLMLVATELAFDHPRTGKRMTFSLAD